MSFQNLFLDNQFRRKEYSLLALLYPYLSPFNLLLTHHKCFF
nr:MAG TPA: hypothetical protein [Caudoviricetes sp.]